MGATAQAVARGPARIATTYYSPLVKVDIFDRAATQSTLRKTYIVFPHFFACVQPDGLN